MTRFIRIESCQNCQYYRQEGLHLPVCLQIPEDQDYRIIPGSWDMNGLHLNNPQPSWCPLETIPAGVMLNTVLFEKMEWWYDGHWNPNLFLYMRIQPISGKIRLVNNVHSDGHMYIPYSRFKEIISVLRETKS